MKAVPGITGKSIESVLPENRAHASSLDIFFDRLDQEEVVLHKGTSFSLLHHRRNKGGDKFRNSDSLKNLFCPIHQSRWLLY